MGLFKRKEKVDKKIYSTGLNKSRKSLKDKINALFARFRKVDEEYFESLEELLIGADLGASLSMDLIESLKEDAKENKISDPNVIFDHLIMMLKNTYLDGEEELEDINMAADGPTVFLVMGVNGVGKTTSIAKIANKFKEEGKKVLLVAADTFRAGAVEQLTVWAERIGVRIISGKVNSDPSGVIFEGVKVGKEEGYDVIICDTAGRLQTKINLMNEANKMVRVIQKIIPEAPHETLLVIDATTGQNGVFQAKAFAGVANVSGIVLTKMDGTSKGGIVFAIKDQLGIPVKFIGLGEKIGDLQDFDLDSYVEGLVEKGE